MRLIDVKILGIPRRGKFYQDPGLKHTSDIFHVLTTKTFIIRSSPRTGVRLTLTKKNQTNERSHVHSFPPPPKSVSRSSALLSRACTLTGLQRSTFKVVRCQHWLAGQLLHTSMVSSSSMLLLP